MMKYKLSPYMRLGCDGETLNLGYGSLQTPVMDKELFSPILELMVFLKKYRSKEEMANYLIVNHQVKTKKAQDITNLFINKNFVLKETEEICLTDLNSRDLLFFGLYTGSPSLVLEKLKTKKIAIVGCGGIGCNMALMLQTKGIKDFVLIDPDSVDKTNLNRLFFYKQKDIGRKKVEVLARQLKESQPGSRIKTIDEKLGTDKKLSVLLDRDLVILSCDDPKFMSLTAKYCYQHNLPHIPVGYVDDVAIWGPLFVPGKVSCYQCFVKGNFDNLDFFKEKEKKLAISINKKYVSPSAAEVTLISSSLAVLDITKYLGEFGKVLSLGKRIGYWSHNMAIQERSCNKKLFCSVCK